MILRLDGQWNKRKLVVQIAVALIALCVIIFFLIPLTEAGIKDDASNTMSEFLSQLLGLNGGAIVYGIVFNKGWIFFAPAADGGTGVTFFATMMLAMKGIAIGLLTVYLMIQIISAAAKNEANMDFVLKMGARVAIMLLLITNIDTLMNAFHQFFVWGGKSLYDAGSKAVEQTWTGITQQISDSWGKNFFDGVGFIMVFIYAFLIKILGILITGIVMLIVTIRGYGLMIEMGVRRLFMPVAMLGFVQDGARSPGMRYLLKYFGLYFRVWIYIAAFFLADALYAGFMIERAEKIIGETVAAGTIGAFVTNTLGILLDYVGLLIAASVLSKKGDQLTDEILGVNSG